MNKLEAYFRLHKYITGPQNIMEITHNTNYLWNEYVDCVINENCNYQEWVQAKIEEYRRILNDET